MKILTLGVMTSPSFRATTRNPVLKLLSRLMVIFGLAMMFTVSGWCDTEPNNSCIQAELISEMDNKSGNYSRIELGTVQNGDDDYYYFTILQSGTLTVNYTSTANTDLRIEAGVSCSSTINRVLNNGTSYSGTLSITAGQTVYVRIARRNGTPNYSLDLTFSLPSANLALTNTDSPDPVLTNGNLVYTLGVSNGGPDTATSLTLTDTLPVGVIFQSATGTGWTCNLAGSVVTCTNPTLANGASAPVTITVTAPATAGTITNTATVISAATDSTPANNTNIQQSTTVNVPSANLALTNTDAPDPVLTNGTLVYTLGVSNGGPNTATSLTLTDTLPVGVIFQSATGTGWSCNQAVGVVICTNPTLANGASAPVAITVTAPSTAGTITNTATVTSAATDSTPANNTNIAQTTTVVSGISINNVSMSEGNISTSIMNFKVTLSADSNNTITVVYTIADGTATRADLDYNYTIPTSGTITFLPHEISKDLNLTIIGDTKIESDENLTVTLSGATNSIIVKSIGIGVILNDDYGYCQTHGLSTGFHVIDPDGGSVSNSFEIFCSADNPKKDLIAFGIKNDSNNFIFNSDVLGSTNYYSQATTNATQFNAIEINPLTLDVITSGTLTPTTSADGTYKVLGKGFSNINLIGTPFAIDWNNTTISGCDTARLTRKGYHGQTVKINTLDYNNKARCQIDSMKLKLLSDYTYLTYNGGEVLQNTCKLMAEAVPTDVLDSTSVKGHYWINPNKTDRAHNQTLITATDRPIITYCWYQTDLNYVWTFMLALDGKVTTTKNDLINKADSCSEKGLWPFVPNNESTFERVRGFLSDNQSEWINYTGTINEKVSALYAGNTYYLTTEQSSPLWPYGSFGVYYPYNGNHDSLGASKAWYPGSTSTPGWMSGSPMHNISTITQDYSRKNNDSGVATRDYYSWGHYSNTDTQAGGNYLYTDTMGYKGWRSVLTDLNKTTNWFISRTGAGDNFNSTSNYPYYEPNGNYTAGAWLNYLFDDQGRVRHNDDWDANYPYYDYMCMAEDNYDFASRYGLFKGPFNVIEHSAVLSGTQYKDANLTTKIANSTMQFDVVLLKNDFSDIRPSNDFNVSAGIFLNDTIMVGTTETPRDLHYFGQISDFNATRFELPASRWPAGVETWSNASKRMFFDFKYCSIDTMKWTDCWTLSGNTATCKTGSETYCKTADSNDFAVRPKTFATTLSTPAPLKAGAPFTITLRALDFSNVNNTADYNETVGGSFDTIVTETKAGCLTGTFKNSLTAGWQFLNGSKLFVDNNYSQVGVLDINTTEGLKPCQSRFAAVDCNDTILSDLTISDNVTRLAFTPDHFGLAVTIQNKGNGFTYLSNDLNMSAAMQLAITAQRQDNVVTTNYSANCYAKNVLYTVRLNSNQALGWSNTQSRIIFNGDSNTSLMTTSTAPAATFRTTDGNFTAGIANAKLNFNFNRNVTIPENLFIIVRNDFNITSLVDDDNISGNDFNRNNDHNTTFVYGRLIPKDIRVFGAVPYSANAWYEVYNASSIVGTALKPSRNDSLWYINTLHNDTADGDANVTVVITGGNPTNITPNIISGIEAYNFGAQIPPYSAKAHIDTESWLWYGVSALPYLDPNGPAQAGADNLECLTHPCFNINVVPAVGATGSAKSTNEGAKGSKKTDTGGGGWHSTSDYAPAIR